MATWAQLRNEIREGILKDSTNKWSTNQLVYLFRWAADQFTSHTAPLRVDTFNNDTLKPDGVTCYDLSSDTVFSLSSEVFEPTNMAVLVDNSDGTRTRLTRLNPFQYGEQGWRLDGQEIVLRAAPDAELMVAYFSYYQLPEALPTAPGEGASQEEQDAYAELLAAHENFDIAVPRWVIPGLMYLTGAHAIAAGATSAAALRTFNTRKDSGDPEDNSFRVQQEHMLKFYRDLLLIQSPQNRKEIINGI